MTERSEQAMFEVAHENDSQRGGRHAGPIKIKDPDAPKYRPRHAKAEPKGPHEPRLVIPQVGSARWRRTTSTLAMTMVFTAVLIAAAAIISDLMR